MNDPATAYSGLDLHIQYHPRKRLNHEYKAIYAFEASCASITMRLRQSPDWTTNSTGARTLEQELLERHQPRDPVDCPVELVSELYLFDRRWPYYPVVGVVNVLCQSLGCWSDSAHTTPSMSWSILCPTFSCLSVASHTTLSIAWSKQCRNVKH